MDARDIQQLKVILCSSYQKHVDDSFIAVWKEINGMKKMVMVAMGGVILQALVFIGAVVLVMIQKG